MTSQNYVVTLEFSFDDRGSISRRVVELPCAPFPGLVIYCRPEEECTILDTFVVGSVEFCLATNRLAAQLELEFGDPSFEITADMMQIRGWDVVEGVKRK